MARESNPLRRSLGLGDETFVAMYSGNMGLAHSFEEFLEAARRLRDRKDIAFVFVGSGPRAAKVHEQAQEHEKLANLRMLDYCLGELHLSLSAADVHLISMRPEMTGIVTPGRLYGIMAAARPPSSSARLHCESADTIRRAGCASRSLPATPTVSSIRPYTLAATSTSPGRSARKAG